jgi:2-C-methyl-D-erythritol 4-phosphate cytidylyltransferase/2-C-methyl-D-erythritol 2,4-cyclodiphosphate synthase
MHVTAIIAAGGRGQRFGGAVPKQFLAVGGCSILERSVALFLAHSAIDEVVVALPAELLADPPSFLRSSQKPLHLVAGGARRQDSVISAFKAANERSDLIVVHDAARPLATSDLVSRTIAAAAESGAALAALAVSDTLKRSACNPADAGSAELLVAETIPRESIFLAQTPQAFRRDVLRDALALAGTLVEATDEATLVERAGRPVRLVQGEATNIKITTREDLQIAETIVMGGKPARTGRAGVGYDLHRLVEGRPLVLGGVTIPFGRGLMGHSDADAVCHAITDAILGAAAEGDIGRHFPDTDPAWHNASSIELLRRAAQLLRERGLEVGNIDASVIAERPRLAPYIDAMRANVAGALGVSTTRISIKGKTNEGVGELGRGEAIAVHAIALVRQSC